MSKEPRYQLENSNGTTLGEVWYDKDVNHIVVEDSQTGETATLDGSGLHINEGTVGNDPILGGGTTSSVSPGFGTWTQASSSRPALIILDLQAQTDGTSDGQVDVEIDESGGTTADYSRTSAYADSALGSGATDISSSVHYIPAGAQYQIVNTSDPNAFNNIAVARQLTL